MTGLTCQQLRKHILDFMTYLPIPPAESEDDVTIRDDGVEEFGKYWCVRGDHLEGVFASFSDNDDVIEFGLLERNGEIATNLLHVAVVLDDDNAEISSMSEASGKMNFNVPLTRENMEYLDEALDFFENGLRDANM